MSELLEWLNQNMPQDVKSLSKVVERQGCVLALNGLRYCSSKYGETAVFSTTSGESFWASNAFFVKNLIPLLLEYYEGSIEDLNAGLKAEPLVIEVGDIRELKNGHRYRHVKIRREFDEVGKD